MCVSNNPHNRSTGVLTNFGSTEGLGYEGAAIDDANPLQVELLFRCSDLREGLVPAAIVEERFKQLLTQRLRLPLDFSHGDWKVQQRFACHLEARLEFGEYDAAYAHLFEDRQE